MSEFVVLVRMSLRNLFANFLNVIIGGIVLVGTFFFVVGSSILGDINNAMSKSITGSMGGHVQVYSDKSKEELAIFDNWGSPDLAVMPDFSKVKKSLSDVQNIKAIIPMGINGAFLPYGNTVDQALEKLRKAVNQKNREQIESLKSHVRQMIRIIQAGYKNFSSMSSAQAIDPKAAQALEKVSADAFWKGFDADPLNHLEFLENNIASLVPDSDFAYLSYVGTDLEAFQKSFDRMRIVDGTAVPKGQRGLLLSKYIYEHQFKLKIAHRLDQLHEALTEQEKVLAKDPDLKLLVKQNRAQVKEIVLQLDPISTARAVTRLQAFLSSKEKDVSKLLSEFLDTTDENLVSRHAFFYKELAPLLELYRVVPGDSLTIKAFTKSGFVESVNLKVYGTFEFKGLEKSGLAGGLSLMDLMSFRDLYGFMTPDRLEEMKEIAKATGAKIMDRAQAEAELFGGSSVVTTAKEKRINDNQELIHAQNRIKKSAATVYSYTTDQIDQGVAINAALILNDPTKMADTMKEIESISKKDGLDLRVVTWQKAAGNIGQFVVLAKLVLYIAIFIIFIVALVVINNAVMMATLQRVREIGTMRAIGAQRSFVLSMVLMETILLGTVFGCIGVFLGSAVVKWLGVKGIPAGNEFLYFFFSGPRLYTTLGMGSVVGAFVIILLVTTLSALYPAVLATRVSPIRAMSSED